MQGKTSPVRSTKMSLWHYVSLPRLGDITHRKRDTFVEGRCVAKRRGKSRLKSSYAMVEQTGITSNARKQVYEDVQYSGLSCVAAMRRLAHLLLGLVQDYGVRRNVEYMQWTAGGSRRTSRCGTLGCASLIFDTPQWRRTETRRGQASAQVATTLNHARKSRETKA